MRLPGCRQDRMPRIHASGAFMSEIAVQPAFEQKALLCMVAELESPAGNAGASKVFTIIVDNHGHFILKGPQPMRNHSVGFYDIEQLDTMKLIRLEQTADDELAFTLTPNGRAYVDSLAHAAFRLICDINRDAVYELAHRFLMNGGQADHERSDALLALTDLESYDRARFGGGHRHDFDKGFHSDDE